MARMERLARIRQWLAPGRCLSPDRAQRELEISRATLNRDIAFLRDRLGVPVEWERERCGWVLAQDARQQFEIPHLWFNAEEVHALLTMQHLLSTLDAGGLLGPYIEPLMRRLHQILGSGVPPRAEVARRIRERTVGARRIVLPHFQAVGSALLQRKRLVLHYRARSSSDDCGLPLPADEAREVSPQRLVHYRDNWYLDAWCHRRQALRSFSVDAIERVSIVDAVAAEIADSELDAELGVGYGIFAGRSVQRARLRFSPERSKWVAAERWHPDQHGSFDAQGRWQLDLPYSDPRELVMDVLRHVPEVEVLWPEELAEEVARRLRAALAGFEAV